MKLITKGPSALKLTLGAAAGALMLFSPTGAALAQDAYPSAPIEFLIPFSAGGGNDQVARTLAPLLEANLGQSVVPINKAGAGGFVAAQVIVSGQADGYRVSQQSLGTFILTSLLRPQQIAPLEDVRYIGQIAILGSAIAVRKDSPYKTLNDLKAAMQAKPGDISWAHTGQGGFNHINGVSLMQAMGVEGIDVPFKGSSKTVAALVGGHIDAAMLATSNIIGFEDEIRFLAVMAPERNSLLPDVPTVSELGLDMVIVETPTVVVAHKDTPDAIATRLEAGLREAVANPQYADKLQKLGITPKFSTGAEVRATLGENIAGWRALIKKIKTNKE